MVRSILKIPLLLWTFIVKRTMIQNCWKFIIICQILLIFEPIYKMEVYKFNGKNAQSIFFCAIYMYWFIIIVIIIHMFPIIILFDYFLPYYSCDTIKNYSIHISECISITLNHNKNSKWNILGTLDIPQIMFGIKSLCPGASNNTTSKFFVENLARATSIVTPRARSSEPSSNTHA